MAQEDIEVPDLPTALGPFLPGALGRLGRHDQGLDGGFLQWTEEGAGLSARGVNIGTDPPGAVQVDEQRQLATEAFGRQAKDAVLGVERDGLGFQCLG